MKTCRNCVTASQGVHTLRIVAVTESFVVVMIALVTELCTYIVVFVGLHEKQFPSSST